MSKDEQAVVLIVDDDKNTRDGLQRALQRNYKILTAEHGDQALATLGHQKVDIVLSDVRMPGMDGIALLQRALALNPELIVILLTAYGNVETAVEAMKHGAYDFLMKPVNLDHLDLLVQRALRSRDVECENMELRRQLEDKFGLEQIIGTSDAMRAVFETIHQAAPTQATILIQGESGTGKELVAHAIHQLSTRNRGPFVAVHCAALSASLLESELFGHEKGAFTGATGRREGRFERATGGTLFLDEISEIEKNVQVKLLRVLEERAFERVGGNSTVNVDIRLVAATNKNLKQLVSEDKFRDDLYFRLDVVSITLPPLRARRGDIPLLCNHFLKEFSHANGKQFDGITADAMSALTDYDWPGNVRELRNTIEKMVVLSRGTRLTARDIPQEIRSNSSLLSKSDKNIGIPAETSLADTERLLIVDALKKNNGNRTKAAEALGISRRTLHRKINEYRAAGMEM